MNTVTPKPSSVSFKPAPQILLMGASLVKDQDFGSIEKVEAPKPKARPRRDEEKTYVTNTAFRDSEPLRELQRSLHRAENKRGKA